MSWLYAALGADQETVPSHGFEDIHANPLFVVGVPSMYIAAGGISETCLYESEGENSERGWVVVGLGIDVSEGSARLMDKNDWRRVLSEDTPWSDSLNGHFAALRWRNGRVELFTDELGQRALYFAKYNHGICISTRVDWVSLTTGHTEVDFSSFGGKWLTFNQLDYGSCVVGIERIGPRGHALFERGDLLKKGTTPWLPEFSGNSIDRAVDILMSLLRAGIDHDRQVSLGLSGGIDSRLILACLLSIDERRFAVHTFGHRMDPDVAISSSIAAKLRIGREFLDEPLPDVNATVTLLKEYAAQACVVEPSSSFLKLRYYSSLHQQGKLLIDGGFGEIARRQYLNRVVRFGRTALRSRNVSRLLPLLLVDRGDIFSAEWMSVMLRGAREGLEQVLIDLPRVDEIGVENSVDLLAVRTRIPNYGAPEQSRLDGEVINFMPLVQPSFLRAVFGASVRARSNARFYRELIRNLIPDLATIPLVKAGTTYPFSLSTSTALVLTRLKSRLGKRFIDPGADDLLLCIREFVLDMAHSKSVVEWGAYDPSTIRDATDAYYVNGDHRARNIVDWWLAFELWRTSLFSRRKICTEVDSSI